MPASLTRDEVARVAQLARLKLSDAELDRFTSQLGQVLEYVDLLGEVETENVEPMAHAADVSNVFRDDVVEDALPRDEAMANAPKSDGEYFLVPRPLEGA